MNNKQPDAADRIVGFAVVALVLAWVGTQVSKNATTGVALGLLGAVAHEMFDAPVSQAASDLGV